MTRELRPGYFYHQTRGDPEGKFPAEIPQLKKVGNMARMRTWINYAVEKKMRKPPRKKVERGVASVTLSPRGLSAFA
jgi:hypothetical protein